MVTEALSDLSPKALQEFSKSLPSSIKKALEFPTVSDQLKLSGLESVKTYLEFELIQLSRLVSVGGNINDPQVDFIASELIRIFPNESIADFKLCFQRGAIGQYGDIYRMDGIILRAWMEKYLEEKYKIIEDDLKAEKEDMYKIPKKQEIKSDKHQHWLNEWKKAIDPIAAKKVMPLTPEEIKSEGQKRPKAKKHDNGFDEKYYILYENIAAVKAIYHKGVMSFSNYKIFIIGDHEVFAKDEDQAKEIYQEALKLK